VLQKCWGPCGTSSDAYGGRRGFLGIGTEPGAGDRPREPRDSMRTRPDAPRADEARPPARSGDGTRRRGLYRVKQFIHNHVLKVNGDRAEGYAYLEAKPVYNGESYVVAARYNDEYAKRNGQWRFTKMSLTPFFMVPLKEGWAGDDLLKMGR